MGTGESVDVCLCLSCGGAGGVCVYRWRVVEVLEPGSGRVGGA